MVMKGGAKRQIYGGQAPEPKSDVGLTRWQLIEKYLASSDLSADAARAWILP